MFGLFRLFRLFKTPSFRDPALGELRRQGGMWRAEIALGDIRAPLALPGSRAAPDPQALAIARSIPTDYPDWRAGIAASLFEHYAPYAEAVATGAPEAHAENPPRISQPDQVWQHAAVEFVAVITLDGEPGVEIGYRVAWDEEHTLGARLRDGRLLELNGSVLPP